ncbi:integrase, catalytic region, zinc finger, CCHC-type containing protein [Tanacetum coccineum]
MRTPQQNGVVERRNRTLVEAARTMLIFSKALLFLWAEAINTAFTRLQRKRSESTTEGPRYLLKNPCDVDDANTWLSEHFSSGLGFTYDPATSSTGLGSNHVSQQPCIPPIINDWDCLFQPMFDEYFNPPPATVSPVQEAPTPIVEVLADSPVSTSIDQDAPSTSIPTSQEQEHSPIISQGFEESPKTSTFHNDPLNESPNKDSTSHGSSSNVKQIHTSLEHIGRWTKDHPIANVIGDPSHSVSTRKQLHNDAMWCYFDAFLTSVEPKNFKQAMTESSWIDELQEEIHEFERLEV